MLYIPIKIVCVLQDNKWKKVKGKSSSNVPKGRRGHTALVYRNSMIIYGGYRDLKGSTNEMWAFHFGNFVTDNFFFRYDFL